MNTITRTYTRTDIRKVFENFQADLQMLAVRTQAMELDHAQKSAYDVSLMAQEECLKYVHVQLYDLYGNRVRAHRYVVDKDIIIRFPTAGRKQMAMFTKRHLMRDCHIFQ